MGFSADGFWHIFGDGSLNYVRDWDGPLLPVGTKCHSLGNDDGTSATVCAHSFLCGSDGETTVLIELQLEEGTNNREDVWLEKLRDDLAKLGWRAE